MLAKQLIMAIDDLIKSNPEGINQYTAGGGSNDKADAANAKTLFAQHQTSSDFHDERAADARQNANYVLANAHQAASNSFATAAKLYDTSNADADEAAMSRGERHADRADAVVTRGRLGRAQGGAE